MRVALTSQQRRLAEEHLVLATRAVSSLRRRVPRHADFDELSGEAHLALVRAARSWKGSGSFPAYASVCIRNALRDAAASAARASHVSLDSEHVDEPLVADTNADAIALADYRAARARLTELEQKTIALAAAGFAPSDQAALLRLPALTVRQRLWRARQRLAGFYTPSVAAS